MTISILGCGWYGKALATALINSGNIVKGSSTSPKKMEMLYNVGIVPYLVDIKPDREANDAGFFDCDLLVISIPPKTRQGEGPGYLQKIQRVIEAAVEHHVTKVIYISSTAVYEELNGEVNELNIPVPDTESGKILFEAENLFKAQIAFKTTIIRFAGLVGPGRHPGRFFSGKKAIPNGLAPVNLVHLDDCIGITRSIIDRKAFGYLFNVAAPDHPAKSAFYTRATLQAGLIEPEFINELGSWKIISSVRLHELLNYRFKVSSWTNFLFN
ncbi:SDR family oxidoreductase [Mucilaginibacter xinganensis]|uniref:Uncharacterized protein n=1 Tax=Mucilaginibacter xinganensis TaxID=1234841 RepID=A0A223NXV9_9SPHI|nr:SDR family oxidoreductase [Mucilaginibacter xinganensis]ASU34534.1 hypothetical protein MuYL_2647 [Mucilaginibacter xinganensis]